MNSRQRKQPERFPTLKAWRTARGFTLQQAADYVGLPLTSYFNIERGIRRPRATTMRVLMARTNVSLEFLAGVA